MKYGNLNFLEISGPLQACNGTALPLLFTFYFIVNIMSLYRCADKLAVELVGNSYTYYRHIKKNQL